MPTDERITGVIEFESYKSLEDDELVELRSMTKLMSGSHSQVMVINQAAAVKLVTELRWWLDKPRQKRLT
jgi:hypothetical protein